MAPSRPPRPPHPPPRLPRDPRELLKKRGTDLIRKVSDKDRYAIFLEPVDLDSVDGYADVIQRPMDLSTAQKNLQMGVYRTPMELRTDLDLIWSNCCTFNADDSIYYKEAVRLRALCARYYDDLVRLLIRDGVAPALGLTNPRHATPVASRIPGKRPPRHRPHAPAVPLFPSSYSNSPEPDHDASYSFSASATAPGPHLSFRDTQLRKARNAADAAAAAAAAAEGEARKAAVAAGLVSEVKAPPNREIFAGPGGILRDKERVKEGLPPREFPALNHRRARDRCSEVPLAWRRVGRHLTGGATVSRFNTEERAREVREGRMFQKYIDKTAPFARRLLATILDPEVVRQHDLDRIAKAKSTIAAQKAGKASGVQQNGCVGRSGKHTGTDHGAGEENVAVANGFHEEGKANGKVEDTVDGAAVSMVKAVQGQERTEERAAKRLRVMSGEEGAGLSAGRQFVEKIVQEAAIANAKKLEEWPEENGKQAKQPSRRAVEKLQKLLKERGIDHSFLRGLDPRKAHALAERESMQEMQTENMERLLHANHNMMMNVMRLRSLREGAEEADVEDLEDRERECAEELARGMGLAAKRLAPKHLIHSVDVRECWVAMAQTIQPKQDPEQ